MELLRDNTPIESHSVNGVEVFVKREDLSCPSPGPSFSKIRGVVAHLQKRPEKNIGVLDTYHSKAGWGVSYICAALGRRAVVFYPEYKGENGLRDNQKRAFDLGATLVPLKAGRSAILYHQARKLLHANFENAYLMPNALKLSESVDATAAEVWKAPKGLYRGTWVVSVSSGTLASGVLKGLIWKGAEVEFICHMGYSRSRESLFEYLKKNVGGVIPKTIRLRLVDEGWAYKDKVAFSAPFPCNEYYDLKAWAWLHKTANDLVRPIVFWNIGE